MNRAGVHSAASRVVQAKHWPAGGEANAATLGPGSHWYQPGKAAHGDECVANECLLLIQMEGPYDFAVAK